MKCKELNVDLCIKCSNTFISEDCAIDLELRLLSNAFNIKEHILESLLLYNKTAPLVSFKLQYIKYMRVAIKYYYPNYLDLFDKLSILV